MFLLLKMVFFSWWGQVGCAWIMKLERRPFKGKILRRPEVKKTMEHLNMKADGGYGGRERRAQGTEKGNDAR